MKWFFSLYLSVYISHTRNVSLSVYHTQTPHTVSLSLIHTHTVSLHSLVSLSEPYCLSLSLSLAHFLSLTWLVYEQKLSFCSTLKLSATEPTEFTLFILGSVFLSFDFSYLSLTVRATLQRLHIFSSFSKCADTIQFSGKDSDKQEENP